MQPKKDITYHKYVVAEPSNNVRFLFFTYPPLAEIGTVNYCHKCDVIFSRKIVRQNFNLLINLMVKQTSPRPIDRASTQCFI